MCQNCTIQEMARCMLEAKDIPKDLWAEAVHTAVHIINRSPTKSLGKVTPYEALYREKPKVDYFRTFGCTAYVHVPDSKRGKLYRKSTICIFIGYCKDTKAYRLFYMDKNKIVTSRDVEFYESS